MSAYKLLERFNFGGPKQMTRIGDLSGENSAGSSSSPCW